jgi:hypothetical protein
MNRELPRISRPRAAGEYRNGKRSTKPRDQFLPQLLPEITTHDDSMPRANPIDMHRFLQR